MLTTLHVFLAPLLQLRLCSSESLAVWQEAIRANLEKGVPAKARECLAKLASSALVFAALKKGTLDNVMVVVIMLPWD